MITFLEFILTEEVTYKTPTVEYYNNLSDQEHDETTYQTTAYKNGEMEAQPDIAKALLKFSKNKSAFTAALKSSSIEKIKAGTEVNNSEIGTSTKNIEDKTKLARVRKQIKASSTSGGIDRPIVLRHTDIDGTQHIHLLAGNTRATVIGYGVEVHYLDV